MWARIGCATKNAVAKQNNMADQQVSLFLSLTFIVLLSPLTGLLYPTVRLTLFRNFLKNISIHKTRVRARTHIRTHRERRLALFIMHLQEWYNTLWLNCVSEMLHSGDLSSSMESLTFDSSVTSPGVPNSQQRTKRMRTSFKHHQLRTMKSYFNINQNPDAKDLKQLAQKTGLSKRVLQVVC